MHANDVLKEIYADLKANAVNAHSNFAILKVYIPDGELRDEYLDRVISNNHTFITNPYADSGFDLLVPRQTIFERAVETHFMNLEVKTEMVYCDVARDQLIPCGYYVYPRSSISKTPLMLANHVGIIDSGYRGSIIAGFRMLSSGEYTVERYSRLVQICHPTLCPIFVILVGSNELSSTERGAGGFGSTGI
jgi:dUTP pyrophosphatase